MLRVKKEETALFVWYIVIIALSLSSNNNVGLFDGCSILQRLSYPLFHQNVFHALLNIYVMHQCYRAMSTLKGILIFYAFAISYPFSLTTPIVGMSGIVYAYMGYIAPYVKNKVKYNVTIIAYISFGLFIPCMAIGVHIYCYVIGLLWSYLNAPLCKD